jgi:hypothetical protein
MAKTPKPEKQAEKKTISIEEHNFEVTMDRIITFQHLSINRSITSRDPPNLIDAGENLMKIITDKRTQDFIKTTFAKVPDEKGGEKADDDPDKDQDPDASQS